jgi:hypothetical protein
MKTFPSRTAFVLALSAVGTLMVSAADTPSGAPAAPASPAAATPAPPADQAATPAPSKRRGASSLLKLDYKGPVGAPAVRESGGTRGGDQKLPPIYALAPNHVALTTQAQPVLFWYQSKPANAAFTLSLVEPKNPKPLVSASQPKADKSGIHALKLSDWKVTLQPGVEYKWNVSLVSNPEHPSDAEVDSAVIKRVPMPEGLDAKLADASLAEKAVVYAGAGLWYDALESISEAISADPKDSNLQKLRNMLLTQGGLKEAVEAK